MVLTKFITYVQNIEIKEFLLQHGIVAKAKEVVVDFVRMNM